jgi:hypothetical protein
MKLFAIYIGGEIEGANIELHDMRFVVAPSIAETHEELRRQWWGIPKSLHIDCWAEIDQVDGYDVRLRADPFLGPERLYYVNLGGYADGEFLEKHKNVFVVADSLSKAKSRALRAAAGWREPHRDNMYEAEQAIALSSSAAALGLHVHLIPGAPREPLTFTCDYTPIRVRTARQA